MHHSYIACSCQVMLLSIPLAMLAIGDVVGADVLTVKLRPECGAPRRWFACSGTRLLRSRAATAVMFKIKL